jgi:hypothetical protein
MSPHRNRVVRGQAETLLFRLDVTTEALLPRDMHKLLTGRSRDVLYTASWTVKTETSSYLRDVSLPPRCPYTWMIFSLLGGTNVRDIILRP